MEYLPWATVLVVFAGMSILVWKALTIAHDLAQLALQRMPQTDVQQLAPSVVKPSVPTTTDKTTLAITPPSNDVVIDQGLVDFIKKEEGFRAKAYWDYKQWSIGYGTKAKSSSEVIDQAEGERRLREEIANADNLVKSFAPDLPKGVHQALLDLTYNAGPGWEHQSLGAAVKEKKWDTVKADILQYNHAGGQVNAGLTARREAETSWFEKPL